MSEIRYSPKDDFEDGIGQRRSQADFKRWLTAQQRDRTHPVRSPRRDCYARLPCRISIYEEGGKTILSFRRFRPLGDVEKDHQVPL
jgi:hypothetical protein